MYQVNMSQGTRAGALTHIDLNLFCPIAQERFSGIVARGAHDAAAGVRAGAAQVEAIDGRAVASAFWCRTE